VVRNRIGSNTKRQAEAQLLLLEKSPRYFSHPFKQIRSPSRLRKSSNPSLPCSERWHER